jgi:hypothetical protein
MDMSTQVLSVASTSAEKAGLWYYKKDLMWAGVGSEYFQIQYFENDIFDLIHYFQYVLKYY